MEPSGVQLSCTTGAGNMTLAPQVPESLLTLMLFGLLMNVGGVLSITVKATVQGVELPAASATVTWIGCGPEPETVVPLAGIWVMISALLAVQLSEDWARTSPQTSGTSALQELSA